MTGTASVTAPRARVWDALRDPAVLARTIPGCRSLETVGPDSYAMTITAGVASIKGTYTGRVELTDPDPPNAFTLRARGQGAPGTVEATVRVTLTEEPGATRIGYDADAVVGGMVGGVGQRMLAGAARRTAGEFFAAVERALTSPEPAAVPATAAEAAPAAPAGTVYAGRPEPVAPGTLGAFAAGGAVALAGVVVGYLIGRRAAR
ncbi:hypothetical protein GCM10009678_78530 [Actinomadura kijaniata]